MIQEQVDSRKIKIKVQAGDYDMQVMQLQLQPQPYQVGRNFKPIFIVDITREKGFDRSYTCEKGDRDCCISGGGRG